jgi:anthranilate/para-aminobenzoate synthase component I
VLVVDHRSGEVFAAGDQDEPLRTLKRLAEADPRPPPPPRVRPLPSEAPALHRERVAAALELIRAGDIYQVNLARRLDVEVRGGLDGVFSRLLAAAPSPFAALLELPGVPSVCSTSPELFLATRGQSVETHPIKGTRRRGKDAQEDAALRRALDADPKERAELSMVIDLERNDLGKLAIPGSVRVIEDPIVVTHRTLHHRVARVAARMPPGVTPEALLEATLPSGSVTGAPKVRAMEVIAELEASRRGLYTGALGYLGHDGELRLAMAIRTLTVRGEEGHYHSGGGIVADSDPEREVEETRVKALQLAAALES